VLTERISPDDLSIETLGTVVEREVRLPAASRSRGTRSKFIALARALSIGFNGSFAIVKEEEEEVEEGK
jgi:hypothetical protein